MKYFIDTEFIEGFKKPISWLPTIGNWNKPYHSIQLISIGIVAEDGREFYAVSNEFNPKDANQWVKDNVLSKISAIWIRQSNSDIAYNIFRFIHRDVIKAYDDKISFAEEIVESAYQQGAEPHEFYAYYADYDWVVFCSMFGTMMDLPKGFPMYCRDLKQSFDELVQQRIDEGYGSRWLGPNGETFDATREEVAKRIKQLPDYPNQKNEHNALDDAKWNFELYQFLNHL